MKTSTRTRLLSTAIILAAVQISTIASATPVLDQTRTKLNYGVSSVKTVGDTTTVKQTSEDALLNWSNLNTSSNQTLDFVQPNSNALIINEVRSGQVTNFEGHLDANGKVVIINDAGVTFTKGSQVNVGALTASTAKSMVQTKTPGVYNFSNFSTNAAVNLDGTVNTSKDGYVYVMARHVTVGEAATLKSEKGAIILQAGSQYYVVNLNKKDIITVGGAALKQGDVKVFGNLDANSGLVNLRARGTDLNSGFINLTGVVDTSNLTGDAAGTVLIGSRNRINVSGKIDNSGTGAGGLVRLISLHNIQLTGDIDNSSADGGVLNRTGIVAYGRANLTGSIDNSGTASSSINVSTIGPVVIGDLQVGDGTVNIASGGTTNIKGYIDAQGSNPNSLPAKTPSKNGGNINIHSKGNLLIDGYVDAGSLEGKAGNVDITSSSNITTNTKIAGNNVDITAAKNLTINNAHGSSNPDYITAYNGGYPTGPGTGGDINLKAGGNIDVNAVLSSGNINSGGQINITSKDTTTVDAALDTSSSKGKGGNVTIKAGKYVFADDGDYITNGATGDGKVTVKGVVQSQ